MILAFKAWKYEFCKSEVFEGNLTSLEALFKYVKQFWTVFN